MEKTTPEWRGAGGRLLAPKAAFGLMGVINLAPDSFYAPSRCPGPAAALEAARRLLADGADILDLGAESSRPGALPTGAKEEIKRLVPALAAIREAFPDAAISVDTWRAETAVAALEAGADIINDISAARFDPEMPDVLASWKPGYALMHCKGLPASMQNSPFYENVLEEVKNFFESRMAFLVRAGLPEDRIILDPGIGFGKNLAHNLALLRGCGEFGSFARPLLVGISMKSIFGDLLGLPLEARGPITAAASALLWEKGFQWHRAHDAKALRDALTLAGSLSDNA